MDKGICIYTVVPVRKEASETSEMVTQILFGETYTIIEKKDKWAFIELDFDKYKGWIDLKLVYFLSQKEYEKIVGGSVKIVDKIFCTARVNGKDGLFYFLAGSSIPGLIDRKFSIENRFYELTYPFNQNDITDVGAVAASQALQMLNIPYLWGGRSSFGIDCSGLVQTSYKIAGINLLRDASQQINMGETVNFLNEIKIGDVAFFDNEEGRIVHTGILLSSDKIVHASGSVRVDSIDHQGIFNQELEKYTHKLRVIKRMVK